MKYAYYPGCSSEATGVEFDLSTKFVAKKIGMELQEIPDWNCCGATAAHVTNHDLAISLPARNLALAEKNIGCDVAMGCAACFSRMKTACHYVRQSEENRKHIEDIIELPYEAKNEVVCLLDVMHREDAQEAIKSAIIKPLNGVKIASYYGCLLIRPTEVCQFDDAENPTSMDELMALAGATPVDWAFKNECCGASHQVDAPKVGREMIHRILDNAIKNGAEAIVTACPLCMLNLDMRMKEMRNKYGAQYNIPVYFFTELLAMTMGAEPKELGMEKHFTPAIEFAKQAIVPKPAEAKPAAPAKAAAPKSAEVTAAADKPAETEKNGGDA